MKGHETTQALKHFLSGLESNPAWMDVTHFFLLISTKEEFIFHFSECNRTLLPLLWGATQFFRKHDKNEMWFTGMCF